MACNWYKYLSRKTNKPFVFNIKKNHNQRQKTPLTQRVIRKLQNVHFTPFKYYIFLFIYIYTLCLLVSDTSIKPAFAAALKKHPFILKGINDVVTFDDVRVNRGQGYNPSTGVFTAQGFVPFFLCDYGTFQSSGCLSTEQERCRLYQWLFQ